jgi:uncharacterized repeat protein (TIGR01451 family)
VLFWTALFLLSVGLQYAAAMAPQRTLALSGAIYTSNFDGTIVNQNHYPTKPDVYLTGGPCQGGSHLDPGDYYFEVSIPNTSTLLSTDAIGNRKFTVGANGFITGTSGTHGTHAVGCQGVTGVTIQLIPFNDTTNAGGEYKLTVATASTVEACDGFNAEAVQSICGDADQKSDNFKVAASGSLKIVKAVDGGEASGDFTFHVDCGNDGTFDKTVTFPNPGSVTISDLADGAVCTVTETGMPAAPANFHWGAPTITGSPATIKGDATVTVTVTNHLVRDKGSLKIVKVVTGGTATGTFTFHVDCGQDGSFDPTITLPGSGSVTIDNIPAGAHCTVTETDVPTPPAGFKWNDAVISGSPATIGDGTTVTATVTNPLEALPPPNTPSLTIDKSNNAPLVNGLPTVDEGGTVTYTLDYTLADGPLHNGKIEDVLPAGIDYVTGSATSNAEFTFNGYDSGTRTLTWLATDVTTSGSVSYKATAAVGAAGLPQPLENTATISSDETGPDSDTSHVFVVVPPLAETSVPNTAPPTDIAGSTDGSASGTSMLLILLALAGFALAVVFVAPTPASVRKRLR